MQLKSLLEKMIEVHASDVFIIAGLPLAYQASGSHGRLKRVRSSTIVKCVSGCVWPCGTICCPGTRRATPLSSSDGNS